MIAVENRGAVAVIRLDHGKVHALDLELLDGLLASLDEVERSSARAVVVTGTGSVFSAGIDLRRVLAGGGSYLAAFVPRLITAFETLFSFPMPVVAAVNGAAVAGGCILACACDRRIVAEGSRIGASELVVGVPFPVAALEILRWACGDAVEDVVLSGRLYEAHEALAVGLAHEVATPDGLVDRAVTVAGELGGLAPAAFRLAKAQLRRPIVERIKADGPVVDPEVGALWSSTETVAALSAQVEKLAAGRARQPE